MEGDGNPKHNPLVVSAVTLEAPHRAHLDIPQCPVFAAGIHFFLPGFLVSTNGASHDSEVPGYTA